MELHEINPYVRYCAVHKYVSNIMYRGKSELKAYDCRMFYCLEGHGEIIVEGIPYSMFKGTMLIFKNCMTYKYVHSEQKDMVCISANFDFTYEYAACNSFRIPPDKISDFSLNNVIKTQYLFDILYISSAKEAEPYVQQLRKAMESDRKYKNQEMSALMKLIITFAYEQNESQKNSVKVSTNQLITRVCSYIDSNAEVISFGSQIGEIFSYHAYYINRLMVRYRGCTLHEYIRNAKIRKAIEYLTHTELSVSQIAEKCGFCDSSHFSRQFKAVTGCRPSKYRYM